MTAVPTVVFLTSGAVKDRVEGFDPGAVLAKTQAHGANGEGADAAGGDGGTPERLQALVRREPVMLFMKGSPDAPRCGFSRKVVAALREEGVPFGHFDILTDEAVRNPPSCF